MEEDRADSLSRPHLRYGKGLRIHAGAFASKPKGMHWVEVPQWSHWKGGLGHLGCCDERLLAALSSQAAVPIAIRMAVLEIKELGCADVILTCSNGRQRSAGCILLMAMAFFPEAILHFHEEWAMRCAWKQLRRIGGVRGGARPLQSSKWK